MPLIPFEFRAKVWLYDGAAAWHFATLPKGLSAKLKRYFGGARPGFGSIRVRASTGGSAWATSIFPDSKRGAYLLPLKAEVRRKEGIVAGKARAFKIEIEA